MRDGAGDGIRVVLSAGAAEVVVEEVGDDADGAMLRLALLSRGHCRGCESAMGQDLSEIRPGLVLPC